MRKFILLCNSLLLIISVTIKGQLSIKSPDAYTLIKSGNIPVKLHTGLLDLTIPIYSIPINNDKMDIILSYDSSGFIPGKKPNLAGMNWTLIAGGAISRTVKGIPDEYIGFPTSNGPDGNDFHGFLTGVRKKPYTKEQIYDLYSGAGSFDTFFHLGPVKDGYEGEPDEFSFNIFDLYGKFIIGNDGNVLVESNDPNIKVDISNLKSYGNGESCDVPNQEILISDGRGIKYYFGGEFSNQEISYTFPMGLMERYTGFPITNLFSLNKIIFPDGNIMSFEYIDGIEKNDRFSFCNNDNLYFLSKDTSIKELGFESFYIENFRGTNASNCSEFRICAEEVTSIPHYSQNRVLLKKSILKKISINNIVINFFYKKTDFFIKHKDYTNTYDVDFHETLIDYITVSYNNNVIKKIIFGYEDLGGEHRRPFLKSINDDLSKEKYEFEYHQTNNLPPYYTKGVDHWGYWNGKNNQFLTPFDSYDSNTGDYTLNNTFRDADPNYAYIGLLKRIIYPTNGFSDFEYEPHHYGQRLERISKSKFLPILTNNSGITGGARIKKQIDYDESGKIKNHKEYKYTINHENDFSSGILMNWPRYYYFFKQKYGNTIIKTGSSVQQNSLDNYNVGYSKVFEIEKNKGYIEYDFYSYKDKPDILTETNNLRKYMSWSYEPEDLHKNYQNIYGIDRSILRGKIKEKKYFDETGKILKKIKYEYTDNIDFNPKSTIDQNNYVAINHMTGTWVQGYKKYLNPNYLKESVITYYIKPAPITYSEEVKAENINNLNPSSKQIKFSDGHMEKITYQYAHEKGNNYLIDKNVVGVPLETIVTQDGKIISKTETIYPTSQAEANIKTQGLPLPVSSLSYDLENPTKTNQDITYTQYDNKGNLLEYKLNGITPVVIIWGYHQTLPIAKIEGATYEQVKNLVSDIISKSNEDKDEVSEKDLITALDNFRNKDELKNFQITTYTHNPLIGVTSITPPSGIREIYKYDEANRLTQVLDIEGNILKEYNYHYSEPYKNIIQSKTFTRNNCPNGYIGDDYNYIVPAGKYISLISQDDADRKAIEDLNTNGLREANIHASCKKIYYNSKRGEYFDRQNCNELGADFISPKKYYYEVPAGKYISLISQDDADQKALDDIKKNGQKEANLNAECVYKCNFTPITNYYYNFKSDYMNVYLTKNNKIKLGLGLIPGHEHLDWTQEVTIGKLPRICSVNSTPNATDHDFEEYIVPVHGMNNINWIARIKNNGDISLQIEDYNKLANSQYKRIFHNNTDRSRNNTAFLVFEWDKNVRGSHKTTFYNTIQSKQFLRNNCPVGYKSESYTYTVPSGKYYSTISQEDADQKALDDINKNGQKEANLNAKCVPDICSFTPIKSDYFDFIKLPKNLSKEGNKIKLIIGLIPKSKYLNWNEEIVIGKLESCIPTTEVEEVIPILKGNVRDKDRHWIIRIKTTGEVSLQISDYDAYDLYHSRDFHNEGNTNINRRMVVYEFNIN